jgi:hypothetical protein
MKGKLTAPYAGRSTRDSATGGGPHNEDGVRLDDPFEACLAFRTVIAALPHPPSLRDVDLPARGR